MPPPPLVRPEDVALATGGLHALAEVGEGGFGKVYRGVVNRQPVAIKVMAADGLQGQAQFDAELSLLSSLSHAHLVRLLGVCVSASPPLRCLLYELLPGGSVDEHLASGRAGRRALPWWLRVRVAAQVGAAVAYLHGLPGEPLLHRDVKPANMFLDARLNAKLGDFGLATTASEAAAAARRGAAAGANSAARAGDSGGVGCLVGDYPYLPPEYRASGVLSPGVDVYALGVSLLQLATGARERLAELPRATREALAAGRGSELLDDAAGAWDEGAGLRLLTLGAWACEDATTARPSAALLADQLARLWVATDQALRSGAAQEQQQQQQQQQQPAAAGLGLGGAVLGGAGTGLVTHMPACSDATAPGAAVTATRPSLPQPAGPASGSGGMLWRLLGGASAG